MGQTAKSSVGADTFNMTESTTDATDERKKQEMEALELWIDETEKELYDNACKEGRRRSSVILSDEFIELVANLKTDYEAKGFKKRRVQEAMDATPALKPFTSAK